jgi:predicted RNA-binding Zn-ribbon protein involved in translation (DUF1610 family)
MEHQRQRDGEGGSAPRFPAPLAGFDATWIYLFIFSPLAHSAWSAITRVMPVSPPTTRFDCPNCGAKYNLVRAEAGSDTRDREITCRKCGGPLQGREGNYVLKYFLVDRPKVRAAKAGVTRLS